MTIENQLSELLKENEKLKSDNEKLRQDCEYWRALYWNRVGKQEDKP